MEPRGFVTALFDYSFTSFVTPKIIKILYVLATIVVSLVDTRAGPRGLQQLEQRRNSTLVIAGPLFFLLSMIYARVFLELVIVFFRINGNVQELRDGRSGGPVQPMPSPAPPTVDAAVVAPGETAIAPAETAFALEQDVEAPPTPASAPEPEVSARFCGSRGAERRPQLASARAAGTRDAGGTVDVCHVRQRGAGGFAVLRQRLHAVRGGSSATRRRGRRAREDATSALGRRGSGRAAPGGRRRRRRLHRRRRPTEASAA